MATVIIFGNEKGGTGKSTLAVHVAVALARQGLNVAAIDGDINQGSFTKYLANRSSFVSSTSQAALPSPTFISHEWDSMSESELARHLTNSSADVVIVDTPGALTPLSKTLHSFADLVVTPLNDSLVDEAIELCEESKRLDGSFEATRAALGLAYALKGR
ncbi:MAG: AAA family ATPase, partial [Rhodospirillaceae bacterium]|nr:AAA family ATPase [Rhodospirillaceae bacterium]